jgi:hypothetical protein
LLVVFIPGLLMLATFGLQRIESKLDHGTVSATDVAEFLEQAQADDVHTLARDGMPQALDDMHRRLSDRVPAAEVAKAYINDDEWSDLPSPLYAYNGGNPEFQPSRHANRV